MQNKANSMYLMPEAYLLITAIHKYYAITGNIVEIVQKMRFAEAQIILDLF